MKILGINLKPEINKLKYWVHIVAIAILFIIFNNLLFDGPSLSNVLVNVNIIKYSIIIALSDISVHSIFSILRLDGK